jgi:hypothetical protein
MRERPHRTASCAASLLLMLCISAKAQSPALTLESLPKPSTPVPPARWPH